MIKIHEEKHKAKYTLLIPAMLDAHFPLLKYAFYSKNYEPVILENEAGITDVGLKYVNNDMCYPSILNIGQMVAALQSGEYDVTRTRLLMPAAGDACRGSNYFGVLKRAVKRAGFEKVRVLSLNLKGLEKKEALILNPCMVWRALFGLFYGDMLMILVNQLRPYEKEKGSVEACRDKWFEILGKDLKDFKHLTFGRMRKNFCHMAEDFSRIPVTGEKKDRVGLVGEIYIKYCHIGNWDMIKYLESLGCETHTNGLSWYAIYYVDSHLTEMSGLVGLAYKLVKELLKKRQMEMIRELKKHGFYTLEEFETMKREAAEHVDFRLKVGDGWLIGAEVVGHIKHDCPKVLGMQPFGCMPNHVCGRGMYSHLQREFPQACVVSVDVDAGSSEMNVRNRAAMLAQSLR